MRPLPRIGLGCASFAAETEETSDAAVAALLAGAAEAGVRYFDVAPLYGGGRGETLLGRALQKMPAETLVSTKVGYAGPFDYGRHPAAGARLQDFSAAAIVASIEASRRRLRRDVLDIVLLHDPADHLDEATEPGFEALLALKEKGVIGAIGVGTNDAGLAEEIRRRIPVEVALVAGRYTLLDRSAAGPMETFRAHGTSWIAAGVFNSGILAGSDRYNYAAAPEPVLAQVRRLSKSCAAHGVALKTAALQFPARHPAVSTTLVGPRNLAELSELLDASVTPIPDALWPALEAQP